MSETRVVAHFLDGHLLKGTTEDFAPNRPGFHLHPLGSGSPVAIACEDMKALFFVHQLAGDPEHKRLPGFGHVSNEATQGKKIAIRFLDGELLFGYAHSYTSDRNGFFVLPADPMSNNIRIYVMRSATQTILVGEQAEALSKGRNAEAA